MYKAMLALGVILISYECASAAEIWKAENSIIDCMQLLPDKKTLVVCTQRGVLVEGKGGVIFKTGAEIVFLSLQNAAVKVDKRVSLPYRPDLVSKVRLIDASTLAVPNNSELHLLDLKRMTIVNIVKFEHTIVDFASIGKVICATGRGASVSTTIGRFDDNHRLNELRKQSTESDNDQGAVVVATSDEDTFIAISGFGKIRRIEKDGTISKESYPDLKCGVVAAKANRTNGRLAVGCGRGEESVVVFDAKMKQIAAFPFDESIVAVDFLDDETLVCGSISGRLAIADCRTGKIVSAPIHGAKAYLQGIIAIPDANAVLSCDKSGRLLFTTIKDGKFESE